ncbi:MAG TPA: DUF92 domain-containing protein [Salinibacter sp.]|nr:DUF92 domain-containing protein [Salinibacter sp.]
MVFRQADWVVLAAAFVGLGGLVAISELLRVRGWRPTTTRRFVHLGVGLFVVASPLLFSAAGPVYVLATAFVVINAGARRGSWLPGIHSARADSWGTVAMPLVLLLALATTWSVASDRTYILQGAFLVLGLADPLASWGGEKTGGREWIPGATVLGSGLFFGAAFLLTTGVLLEVGEWSAARAIGAATTVAVVTTAIEALGRHGWDNVFVVLGVILVLVPLHEERVSVVALLGASVVGMGFGALAYTSQGLDSRGAVAGGLFAFSLVGVGGWAWALPGFVFFVLSSALSRLRATFTTGADEEVAPRTLRQVLANGGVAWGLLAAFAVLPGRPLFLEACYLGFLGALAAAAADTWATELGVWGTGQPWSLRTGAPVPAGQSGAVSVGGTAAAAIGAVSVAAAAMLGGGGSVSISGETFLGIVGAGLVGMVTDSLAGAFLQARYRDSATGRVVEQPTGSDAVLLQGWRRIDNDAVNLLGTAAGALAALLVW